MLAVKRKADHFLHFFDAEDPAFFSATIHQPEDYDGFEVNIQLADLGDGPIANCSYYAPTLAAAGQIVTSEYHVIVAVAGEGALPADYWLDQLDGGGRWEAGEDDEDEEEYDDEGDGGIDRVTKLAAWLITG